MNNPYDTKNGRMASIDTNANGFGRNETHKFEEMKQNQTVMDSINASKGHLQSSRCDINESEVECGSQRSIEVNSKNPALKTIENYESSHRIILPVGHDPEEQRKFSQMRIAYLTHEGFMSKLCCRPLRCLNLCKDICLEIALFNRCYHPNSQIQALINLGHNAKSIKKVTMSLYMMIEIKDPQESDKILPKYSVCQRIFESVHDFRLSP